MEVKTPAINEEALHWDEFHQLLAYNFANNNAERHNDIKNAINNNDIALAHRLAHNLKSNAGQLRKSALQKAAGDVEDNLESGINRVTPEQLTTLENELKTVITAIKSTR